MEPAVVQSPKPIQPVMDVTPPPKGADATKLDTVSQANDSGVVEAPKDNDSADPVHANEQAVPQKAPIKSLKAVKTSSTPTLAIICAVFACILLSGLAYYAYIKRT